MREKGISPVAMFGVMRSDHRIEGSSLIHRPDRAFP